MSEKRFVYEEKQFPIALRQIRDNWTDKTYDYEDACDLLNGLFEENEQLQIQNKRLRNELNDCEKFRYYFFKRMGELI